MKYKHSMRQALPPQSTYRGRGEIGGIVSALSAGAYTVTLYVMVDRVKGGGRAHRDRKIEQQQTEKIETFFLIFISPTADLHFTRILITSTQIFTIHIHICRAILMFCSC
jgi:hypothetical protein